MTPESLGIAGAYFIKWFARVAAMALIVGLIILAQIADVLFG